MMTPTFLRLPERLRATLHGLLCFALFSAALSAVQAQAPVFNTVHQFDSYADGSAPQTEPIQAPDGTFYGLTGTGGVNNLGTIYKISGGVLTTLHSFSGQSGNGTDGSNPYEGRLLLASDGNLYGTTYNGGTFNDGTVFKVTITPGSPDTYSYKKLFDFNSANGQNPYGSLIQATDGNLYGTIVNGGTNNFGSIYKITNLGTTPVLSNFYSFTNGSPNADGAHPHAGVIQATDGNLYGTTYDGGTSNLGTTYEITLAGVLTTTHNFTGNPDGANPEYGGLTQANDGKIYGTTLRGGTSGIGTIFQVGLGASPTYTELLSFDNSSNPGYYPYSRLIQASDGKLYGTTSSGGTHGDGNVYRIPTGTGNGDFSVYSFQNTNDGYTPYAGLTQGQDGQLYGATASGGNPSNGGRTHNYGVIYKVTTAGTLTPVFDFNNGFRDGVNPYAKVIQATDGNFYGTTYNGGTEGNGTIFKITPSNVTTILHNFNDGSVVSDGYDPQSKLVQARDGNFYGTAQYGGTFGGGVFFQITPAGVYKVLYNFPGGGNGSRPIAGLVQGNGSDNNLYGTTYTGGNANLGTIYKITTAGAITYLHVFAGGTDGANPYAGVTIGSDGNLYGVTEGGGAIAAGPTNMGTFFKLSTAGDTVLYADSPFTGNSATYPGGGRVPDGDLVEVSPGLFYGTTQYGGLYSDQGTVFSATSTGVITPVFSFDGADGANPVAGLLLASDGVLYGTTRTSSAPNSGVVYSLTSGGAETVVHAFGPLVSDAITGSSNPDGSNPYGALIEGTDGNFYGTAVSGGTSGAGTLFQINAFVPFIAVISPATAGVGAYVTIYGDHLTGTSAVTFGAGTATTFIVINDTQVQAQVPANATSGTITLTTPHGTTSKGGFVLATTPAPFLYTVSPNSGAVDALVQITGANFTGATAVAFNGVAASFVVNSASSITATVPSGAATGKISVTTPSGTGYSQSPFTVAASNAPTITGFSPAAGPVGSLVMISGTGFNSVSAVAFHGTSATFIVNSDTQITALVPTGATTGAVSVTTFDGTATSTASFTVSGAPATTITSFTPTQGVVGTLVSLTGTGFTGAKSVSFNGKAARFTVVSDTQITTKVPTGATTGKIAVTASGGTATSAGTFTVGPSITGFTPAGGGPGTSVVITGLNFTGTTAVKFGSLAAASFTVNSATQITAAAPTGVITAPISVTTPVSTATSSASFFAQPTITSFTPGNGPAGTAVMITGTNFTAATAVTFNGVAAGSFFINSATLITAKAPNGVTSGTIKVTAPGGTATSSASFIAAPIITSFTPTHGPAGTSVTILGSGFTNASAVTFNGTTATSFFVNSDTQISVKVPTGATTGVIKVVAPGGTGTSSASFSVP